MKLDVKLVCMPPVSLERPILALGQLKAVLNDRFCEDEVMVGIKYLNYDFATFIGQDAYILLTEVYVTVSVHIIDWYFRMLAFPGLPDNSASFLENQKIDLSLMFERNTSAHLKKVVVEIFRMLGKRQLLEAHIDETIIRHGLHKADVVGFSSMFFQNVAIMGVARRIKMLNPKVIIVMGGPNCESPMGEEMVRNFEMIDFVFSGPALISFPQFIEALLKGKPERCHEINGVFSRINLDRVGLNKESCHVRPLKPLGDELDIDQVILPDYDDFFLERDSYSEIKPPMPRIPFETSRGCWWGAKAHCTFCGLNSVTMGYRSMNSELAKGYFSEMVSKYGSKATRFEGVDNIMAAHYPTEVFAQLKLPEDISIFYEVKGNLSREELSTMKAVGIDNLQPGLESLDNAILKLMKKGATSSQNIRFMKDATQLQIKLHWYWLIGSPGEKEESYAQLPEIIPTLHHLCPPNSLGFVLFYRYSPYLSNPQEYGLDLSPDQVYHHLYPPLEETSLENLAYYFSDSNSEKEYQKISKKWYPLLKQRIDAWKARWYQKDGMVPPELYFLNDSAKVYDSRSGDVVIHKLSRLQCEILALLTAPKSIGKLRNSCQETREEDFAECLETMIDLGLVFHDRRKTFISLVLDAKNEPAVVKKTAMSDWTI